MRTGIGYDCHRLAPDRKLVLGGVHVPFDKGLIGWSDADTLTHSVIDSLLGAAAMGDIGMHFPPGDPAYKNISSLKLLEEVVGKIKTKGFRVNNIDCTIVAEQPRLREYIDQMRSNLASVLGIDAERVSVKASTANLLGFVGREEGMAAWAISTLSEE
ncbi:MAG: 2-C-methyl-D-erythritol 2,4-cyclodiphosphate synthase [Dehalococcoidales bacterium]|jgi:2-C-methyl-D-erythritol 2,4-cyclodiphosphate synthase|nr:2-C-methyl-D-erythritol 2,4-cyclodiphosphate synthase [Dehalococcoidales bacterium]MDD3264847.1 2-C-methyl-D-erythritol 2,4-cyclodiphosphate synthase [Dehalococcoidales bacterium]MDD4322652.1 2-C-methyl-D-erythritol 2,4-cyclodiphosphate synthase [Dehalococcoidales bacterium]MDD4794208.1 2-C-methyl-D-erythritol 2,4-cyclodiphosphate synthase [Dehalococcoidales bacterium]MDD5122297.1 2-C-methyl-D-erythritol 2,4-cyclodiphosphate synthase [Dehalococcoidales bacterium]